MPLPPPDRAALADFAARTHRALAGNLIALKLFGSKATGRDAPDSDLDVLVLVNTADLVTEDPVLDIAFDVNLEHEVYISPRVIAEATLLDPVWRQTLFVHTLLHDSIAL
jgi:predicted nucleotidyltransferase